MIITQLFSVSINSVDVTDKIDSANLYLRTGRVFDLFVIKAAHEPIKGQSVTANVGDKQFSGFVHSVERKSHLLYEIVCRSGGGKLLEPYSEATTKLDNASTSSELFALYSSETGVTITDTTAEIDFLGSFERSGDHATAIEAVANVTGAEVYADGDTVRICPNKPITENGIVIEDNEIFDFAETMDTNDGGGIGFVDINNGGEKYGGGIKSSGAREGTDIAKNTIITELDKSTGELMIYMSPNGTIDSDSGLTSIKSIIKNRTDSASVKDATAIELTGAIKTIEKVTLNGSKITNFSYKNGINVINFSSPVTGRVEVVYKAYAKRAFVKTKSTPDGLFYDYEIVYRDQISSEYGVLHGSTTSQTQIGDDTVVRLDENAVTGENNIFYSDNANLTIRVYHNGDRVDATIEKVASSDPYVEAITYVSTDSYENVFFPRLPYSSILGVEGNSSGYSEVTIGGNQAIVFNSPVSGARISYAMDAIKYTVDSSPNDGDSVSIIVSNGVEETELSYIYNEEEIFSCSLPMTVPVYVAYELDLSVANVVGRGIQMTDENGNSYGTKYPDNFGKISLNITSDGRYKLNTNSILPSSYIIVVVDTGDSLW